jgi:hypothetical protein
MTQFVYFLVAFVILTQSVSKFIIVVNYQLNKDYIAANLCVNKKNLILCCKGKCYLKKQLGEEEPGQKKPVALVKEEVKLHSEHHFYSFNQPAYSIGAPNFRYLFSQGLQNTSPVFHPPCC